MEQVQREKMELLRRLLGRWSGHGSASYPTIETFGYREELEFAANDMQPFVRYEQRTWKRREGGEYAPSHWETGFLRALSSGEIELVCAQGGGRVEIARGIIGPTPDGFILSLHSMLVAGDPRMDKTERQFVLQGNVFEYTMQMSTTAVANLTMHLRASLEKSSGKNSPG